MFKLLIFSIGILLWYSCACAQGVEQRSFDRGNNRSNGVRQIQIDERKDSRQNDHRDVRRYSNRNRNYYRNGRWYRHNWIGWGVAVPVMSSGVLVATLPSSYSVVVIRGNTYYYGDNMYFTQMPEGGYVVVTVPTN